MIYKLDCSFRQKQICKYQRSIPLLFFRFLHLSKDLLFRMNLNTLLVLISFLAHKQSRNKQHLLTQIDHWRRKIWYQYRSLLPTASNQYLYKKKSAKRPRRENKLEKAKQPNTNGTLLIILSL